MPNLSGKGTVEASGSKAFSILCICVALPNLHAQQNESLPAVAKRLRLLKLGKVPGLRMLQLKLGLLSHSNYPAAPK